jgi:predicted NUDIX family NTP pyrophosphohydrolase
MAKRSAGLLPYRMASEGTLEVYLVHPGGPFWAGKDDGSWSVAKGEHDDDDDPVLAAEREFSEEVGVTVPPGRRIDLGELRQPSGKRVRVWAIEAPDIAEGAVVSNRFEMEWPPRSGTRQSFPEVDRALWCSVAVARQKLLKGQVGFVDRLLAALQTTG